MNDQTKQIELKFDEKLKSLEKTLPFDHIGTNCACLTLNNITEILGIEEISFNNLIFPLAGGIGGYKAKDGWQGACGAVCGGVAAIGLILGGTEEKIKPENMNNVYMRGNKFCREFEKINGSVVCRQLCGYDMGDPEGAAQYQKNGTWEKTCYKFVISAVDIVRKITKNELQESW